MKLLQSACCGFLLTVSAAAQMAATPPAQSAPNAPPAQSQTAPPSTGAAPKISTLGGDTVQGPEHPLTLDQMKVLYVAMGYDKNIDQSLQTLVSTQKARAPFIPEDFWDDLDTSFKKIDYPTALLDVYKKYLSVDDAAKLIDFSKTEAGKHFLGSLPETSREATLAIQKQQQQTGMQVQARHKDELDAALKKYREEHQPKPAPSLGAPTPGSGAAPSSSGSPSSSAPSTGAPPPSSTTPPKN